VRVPTEPDVFALEPGPRWPSLEQLRKGGGSELKSTLGPNQVGRLRARDAEFVIVRSETWNKTYGLARDVSRLQGALILVRQAIQLAFRIKDKGDQDGVRIALDHLPELKTETLIPRDLTFDDTHDEDVDMGGDGYLARPGCQARATVWFESWYRARRSPQEQDPTRTRSAASAGCGHRSAGPRSQHPQPRQATHR